VISDVLGCLLADEEVPFAADDGDEIVVVAVIRWERLNLKSSSSSESVSQPPHRRGERSWGRLPAVAMARPLYRATRPAGGTLRARLPGLVCLGPTSSKLNPNTKRPGVGPCHLTVPGC